MLDTETNISISKNKAPDITTNHNVYILGAGFSKDAQLPVISEFLDHMRDSTDWLLRNNRPEFRAVKEVLKFRLSAAGASYRANIDVDNIEELFSLAVARGIDKETEDIASAIAATIDFVKANKSPLNCRLKVEKAPQESPQHWKNDKQPDGFYYTCSAYDLYAGVLSGLFSQCSPDMMNTIITFNYDTLIEDSLVALQVPFSYGFQDQNAQYSPSAKCIKSQNDEHALRILKLHGSVNWSVPNTTDGRHSITADYQELMKTGNKVFLVPPTWRKVFGGGLIDIWKKALHALETATRIIVIGFSMPATDQHFRYLLTAGLQNNISLRKFLFVNPTNPAQLRHNLFKILRPELEKRGVIRFINCKTAPFLLKKEHLELIDRKYSSSYYSITVRHGNLWEYP